jgi:hypothetical protein
LYCKPAIGIPFVMSMAFLHAQLFTALGLAQVRSASRSAAEAASHLLSVALAAFTFHLQEVHLPQAAIVTCFMHFCVAKVLESPP